MSTSAAARVSGDLGSAPLHCLTVRDLPRPSELPVSATAATALITHHHSSPHHLISHWPCHNYSTRHSHPRHPLTNSLTHLLTHTLPLPLNAMSLVFAVLCVLALALAADKAPTRAPVHTFDTFAPTRAPTPAALAPSGAPSGATSLDTASQPSQDENYVVVIACGVVGGLIVIACSVVLIYWHTYTRVQASGSPGGGLLTVDLGALGSQVMGCLRCDCCSSESSASTIDRKAEDEKHDFMRL